MKTKQNMWQTHHYAARSSIYTVKFAAAEKLVTLTSVVWQTAVTVLVVRFATVIRKDKIKFKSHKIQSQRNVSMTEVASSLTLVPDQAPLHAERCESLLSESPTTNSSSSRTDSMSKHIHRHNIYARTRSMTMQLVLCCTGNFYGK